MQYAIETIRANRLKWYEALRSGEYEQCQNKMFIGNKCCCLGVASRVVLNNISDERNYNRVYSALGIGLYKSHDIIRLNDHFKLSFSQIADKIENNPKEYYKEI